MEDNPLNIETDDITIINSFKSGNRTAFNVIVMKYQKKIYWIVRKMVLDHDDANDITQEVFLKIYSSLGDFRGDSKFFTYIYRIAINYSINHLNKNKKINARKVDFETEVYKMRADEKETDEYDSERQQKLLEEAIKSLPEQQRAVFNLRFYENMSYEEIAGILNRSVGGMKANYFHAVKKIQEYVKKKDEKIMEF